MTRPWLLLVSWAAFAVLMTLLWLRQKRNRNAGTVDVAWAFGVGCTGAVLALFASEGWLPRRVLVAGLALLWGLRLATYLAIRVARDPHEDRRYAHLRRAWGERFEARLFGFFQIQAGWVVLFALPMWAAATSITPHWRLLDGLGSACFALSWIGTLLADRQLARFKQRHSETQRVCREGLWAWSRHPNYFFEWIHWLGWCFFALGSGYGYVAILGAALMLFFLLKVTGIPQVEKRALESKGEEYERYRREVSAFVPWPPRSRPAPTGS